MRVALSFPGCHRRGGVERIVFECARFLAGRGHEVEVFAQEWEEDSVNGSAGIVRYHEVGGLRRPWFVRGAMYYRRCSRALSEVEFDVLNTHGCVCPTGGVHWAQSIHRAWLERSREFRGALSFGRLKQRLNPLHPVLLHLEERHFRERAYRKVIATTEEVKADLWRFYGVPGEDVVVIPNGFSPTEFNPERRAERREAERARLGIKPEETVLLFVAHELDRKGYGTILEALRVLGRKDVRLLVVGRVDAGEVVRRAGECGIRAKASLREPMTRLDGDAQVIACGPTRDVAGYHAAADVFVLPTQYEAFCLAILEALGSGLPVVTTTVPGARDAIQPGVNGLLIEDPKSGEELAAALRVMLDHDRREAMTRQAAGTVAEYQWPVVLERYEAVLKEHSNGSC